MKDKWILIALGVIVAVVIVALIGISMNNDSTTNTMGDLNNRDNVTNEREITNNTNNTDNTTNTDNMNNNSLLDNEDNEDMLDKTEFNMLKDEAQKLSERIRENVGDFAADAVEAFEKARDELMTYDQEERQSQEEIDRRSKNLREAIDNLNENNNTNNR